jgi:hypothetical protein
MKKAKLALGVLVLLGAAGCGDSPAKALRDVYSVRNEMADLLFLADDDDSARQLADTKIEKLKKKWEKVKQRVDDFLPDKEHKRDMKDAYEERRAEYEATDRRLKDGLRQLSSRVRGSGAAALTAAAQSAFPFNHNELLGFKKEGNP